MFPGQGGEDYELFKLPFEWSLVCDAGERWPWRRRPLPAHVRAIAHREIPDHDLLILKVNQWTLDEVDRRNRFDYWRENFPGPKIVICRGSNLVDGNSSEAMREWLGDLPVVVTSPIAKEKWGFPNSRFIMHGFSPEEWPATDYSEPRVAVLQRYRPQRHESARNVEAIEQAEREGVTLIWAGRDVAFPDFDSYREFLSHGSIYFNPSTALANPRARAEAMLCGLAVVTTASHGEESYLVNGFNGFASNDVDELIDYLKKLQEDPALTKNLGQAGRNTARREFHIDRYRAEWTHLVGEVLAGGERWV